MRARRKSRPPRGATNVGAAPSPIVGRVAELEQLGTRLAGGERLVTIVGPPGTGKTRLAHELALRVAAGQSALARPKGGVWWADLSVATTADDVTRATAAVLDVDVAPGESGAAAAARVGRAIAARGPVLLVLDNFEQVADAAPQTVAAWMALAPRAVFVATSRELLRIAGEGELDVSPLAVPAEGAADADVKSAHAVQLLLARATGWTPRDDELPMVAEVVRRLEGLPLAVELAASRLRVLGVRELAAELARPLDLLGRGRRDAGPRQLTLRAALESSWALLDDAERRAFARLGLFRGSFDARAAAALVEPSEPTADGSVALDRVQALRDKSLVARADETRLRLFESLRAFALEKLAESGDRDAAATRLGTWLAAEAEAQVAKLGGREQRDALAWLVRERDNLLAAEEAVAAPAVRASLLLAVDPVLVRHGPSGAHRERLDAVLEHGETLDAALRAKLHAARGRVARDAGDSERAVADLLRATTLDAASGALQAELGLTQLARGEFDAARAALDGALALAEERKEPHVEQRARALLGLLAHGTGALDEARTHYERALDLATALGDARSEAEVRKDLGSLCLQRGMLDEAHAYYEQALAKRGGDRRVEGLVLGNLAILAQERGDLDGALESSKRAIATMRALGDRPFEGHLLGYLAGLAWERGDLDEARTHYARAVTLVREAGDVRLEGLFLAGEGALDAARGDAGRAANAFDEAARKLDAVGDPGLLAALDAHRGHLALLRARAAREAGDGDDAMRGGELELEARERLRRTEPHAATSDDVRFARRLLSRALTEGQLVVGQAGAWFRVPGGETVELASRPTLARLLAALADARRASPGAPVSVDALLAAAWPGEKVLARAATNRVKVAVSTLRTLGLRGTLLHREDGYLLSPHVPLDATAGRV